MDLNEIYTQVIAEHCSSTKNRREIKIPMLISKDQFNCGDELRIGVKLENGKIKMPPIQVLAVLFHKPQPL